MATSLVIEEERGTCAGFLHPHNGYFAGSFTARQTSLSQAGRTIARVHQLGFNPFPGGPRETSSAVLPDAPRGGLGGGLGVAEAGDPLEGFVVVHVDPRVASPDLGSVDLCAVLGAADVAEDAPVTVGAGLG